MVHFCYSKNTYKHKKSRNNKYKKVAVNNDDDRKLLSILVKIEKGVKDSETSSTKTIIKKNEHFNSMDEMHSLDYEKLGEVR